MIIGSIILSWKLLDWLVMVMVVLLLIICVVIIVMVFGIIGLIFFGMIEEFGCKFCSLIFFNFVKGLEFI